jgi:hypothetical protein
MDLSSRADAVDASTPSEEVVDLVRSITVDRSFDLAAELIEAAITWMYLIDERVPESVVAEVTQNLTAFADRTPLPALANQAREVARAFQATRSRQLDLAHVGDWPGELLARLAPVGDPTDKRGLLQVVEALPALDSESQAGVLGVLERVKKPRKGSKLRSAAEASLLALDDPRAAALVKAWNTRPKWRGTPKPDPTLPLEQRLEEWVFEADARYDIPSSTHITSQQVGMFLRMAEELCGIETAAQWREAAVYFEAENFHGLVDGCLRRAERS